MNQSSFSPTIDEYLRKRLIPVEGAIPQLAGVETYGNSIPAGGKVGGDLFEYINFQQRYNIRQPHRPGALKLAKLYLDPLPAGQPARYGALEVGTHRFYEKGADCCEKLDSTPGFANVWKQTPDGWKVTRELSYGHP